MMRLTSIATLCILLAFGLGAARAAEVEMDALKALSDGTSDDASGGAESATHVVVHGDTLRGIAATYLGDPDRWPEIYEANKDKISDPHWIYPGQSFVIPGGSGGSSAASSGGTVAASGGASAGTGDKPFNKKLPLPKGTYSVTSNYGMRMHPIEHVQKMHNGIDLGAGLGTPVHATGGGTVITASTGGTGYGNYIKIRHDDGTVTVYAHLQSGSLKVSQGQRVEAGAHIAGVNSTGSSTGNHLHFEVRPGGTNTADPAKYWSF